MNNIRLLLAHPMQSASEVNVPLYQAVKNLPGVSPIDLYGVYPRLNIDTKLEQQALSDCDILVIQCPIFWYSTPSIISVWFAIVLQYGFAYGQDGNKLHGKKMMLALTAGGPIEAYSHDGLNNYSLRELLRHIEQTATLIGMDFLPPFVLGASRTAKEEGRVSSHIEAYKTLIHALVNSSLDEEKLKKFDIVTAEDIDSLVKR